MPLLLKAYQSLRHSRATMTQLDSRSNGLRLHYCDGAQQIARDNSMRESMEAALRESQDDFEGNANMWTDRTKNRTQFDYDADREVARWWEERGRDVLNAGASARL